MMTVTCLLQVLTSSDSCHVHREITRTMPILRRYTKNKLNMDQVKIMGAVIDRYTEYGIHFYFHNLNLVTLQIHRVRHSLLFPQSQPCHFTDTQSTAFTSISTISTLSLYRYTEYGIHFYFHNLNLVTLQIHRVRHSLLFPQSQPCHFTDTQSTAFTSISTISTLSLYRYTEYGIHFYFHNLNLVTLQIHRVRHSLLFPQSQPCHFTVVKFVHLLGVTL